MVTDHAPVAAVLGNLITKLGDQLFPAGKVSVGNVEIGGSTYSVDRSDRFGRACFFGASQEHADLALFCALCSDGDVVWDIGSNFGLYAVGAAKAVGASGKVIAAEPNGAARSLLMKNVEQNGLADKITVLPCAVADADGTADFFEMADSAFSGLTDTKRSRVDKTTTVDVRTVESLSNEFGLSAFDLMKIDVEGFEMEVLQGALPLLEKSPNAIVQFEVSVKNLADDREQQLLQFVRNLEKGGYRFWLGPTLSRGLTRLDLENQHVMREFGGNWFMCREGSSRNALLEEAGTRLSQQSTAGSKSAEIEPLVTALTAIVADSRIRRQKLTAEADRLRARAERLEKQVSLNQWSETRLRPPPLYGNNLALRPRNLASVESISAIVRVQDADTDLESTMGGIKHFCGDMLQEVMIVDSRPVRDDPLPIPPDAILITPSTVLSSSTSNHAAYLAAVGAAKCRHLFVIDSASVLKPTSRLESLASKWRSAADEGRRIGALALLPSSRWTQNPWNDQDTLIIAHEGLYSATALSALKRGVPSSLSALGISADISLQLSEAGFAVVSSDLDVIANMARSQMEANLTDEDIAVLARRWKGMFVPSRVESSTS